MPSSVMRSSPDLDEFQRSFARLRDGYSEGRFNGRRWSATVKRSADGRRAWLFAEELGGTDIVSFNWYAPGQGNGVLKPCEMSSSKVTQFVLMFEPADIASSEQHMR